MAETAGFAPGIFCWVDSGTYDVAKAKGFYSALFGWDYADSDDGDDYAMCLRDGKLVGGLYALSQDMAAMGVAPHWTAYVAVADADEALRRAEAAGGRPVGPVVDVPDYGRAGAFSDREGALLGIWQPDGLKGFGLLGEHGTVVWCELQARDVAAAGAFYGAVFGWQSEPTTMPDGTTYHLLRDGQTALAGMMEAEAEAASEWSVYFQVNDADLAVGAATRAGGSLVIPVWEVETVGRLAVLRSADGASFSILEPAPMG